MGMMNIHFSDNEAQKTMAQIRINFSVAPCIVGVVMVILPYSNLINVSKIVY